MKKTRKLALLTAVLMLLSLFASCKGDGTGTDTTDTSGAGSQAPSGFYTDEESGTNGEIANLISENYRIIYGAKEREDVVTQGSQAFYQKVFVYAKVNMTIRSDASGTPSDYEVLVGTTDREENVDISELTYMDYGWSFTTSRVAIYGGSAEALANAVNRFFDKYYDSDARELKVPFGVKFRATYHYPYSGSTITLGGTAVKDLPIIYNSKFEAEANEVYYGFGKLTGVRMTQTKYTDGMEIPAHAITVGLEDAPKLGGRYRVADGRLAFSEYPTTDKELKNLTNAIQYFFANEIPSGQATVELSGVSENMMITQLSNMVYKEDSYRDELDAMFEARKDEILNADSLWEGSGSIYYVSPNGNDANDGLSPEKAWATVGKVNKTSIAKGSVVLFERGGVWNRQGFLYTKAGVIYSAYGEGDKPLFSNEVNASKTSDWTKVGENLWVYSGSYTSGLLDEYPNDTSIPGSYVTSTNYDNDGNDDIANIILNGGEGWGVKMTRHTTGYSVNLGVVWTGFEEKSYPSIPFADETNLRDQGTFYHNPNTSRLYFYSTENPAEKYSQIQLVVRGYGVGGGPGESDGAVLDNLAFKYFGAHGVNVKSVNNFTIRNCEIGWIGGSIQTYDFGGRDYPTRFGEGIQNWGSCDGFYIEDSWLYQVYDGAVSSQQSSNPNLKRVWMKDIQVKGCLFEYNTCSIEMWQTLASGQEKKPDQYGFEGMRVTDNYFRNLGYGFGNTRPGTAIYEDECDGFNVGDGYIGAPGIGIVDCEMTDNIMWNTRKQFVKGLYWGMESGYKMYGNTFLAEYGSNFAMLPKDFKHIQQWDYKKYTYTDSVLGDLADQNVIGPNTYYFLYSADK